VRLDLKRMNMIEQQIEKPGSKRRKTIQERGVWLVYRVDGLWNGIGTKALHVPGGGFTAGKESHCRPDSAAYFVRRVLAPPRGID